MDRVLLDTDIFSDVLKRKNKSVIGRANAYRARHGKLTLSSATVMEIVRGLVRLDAHKQLQALLNALVEAEIVPIDQDIAVVAGRIDGALSKRGIKIGINDALIGATAIQLGLTLATGNFEHYERIVDLGYPLELVNWRDS